MGDDSQKSSDATLFAAARTGDHEAWRTIFDTHFPSLVDYATSILRSTEAAEDLVAEIFARLIERPSTFAPRQTIRAYLLWLVHRRALNAIRGDRREQARYAMIAQDQDVAFVPVELSSQDEVAEDIAGAFDALSPVARSIVLLRLRQELDYDEIAAVMEMSRSAVKMQLSRTLRTLREQLRRQP